MEVNCTYLLYKVGEARGFAKRIGRERLVLSNFWDFQQWPESLNLQLFIDLLLVFSSLLVFLGSLELSHGTRIVKVQSLLECRRIYSKSASDNLYSL
jgi:hypothetical protein